MAPRTKTANFFIGCSIFVLLGFVGSIGMGAYVRRNTTDKTMQSTNQWMGCSLWWLAIVCMWTMWACVFLNGMNPMLQPIYTPITYE